MAKRSFRNACFNFQISHLGPRIETDTILPITIVYSEKVPKQTANKN